MSKRAKMASIALTALLVISGCTSMSGQTTGQYIDDSTITTAVKANLVGEKTAI